MMRLAIGRPSEKQKLFLSDAHRNVGYGGARGGGKSWAIRAKTKIMAAKFPGIRQCIVRRTYPELEANHIRVLVPEMVNSGFARYNKQDKRLTCINGSVIEFRYAQNSKDMNKFQGQEWDIVYVDEATQWPELELKMVTACCRGANSFPKRVYYTCNPGGVGHAYIKRIFIDRHFDAGENPDDYSFTQSLVQDNDALMSNDPEYVKSLEALPPKLRKAWLEGSWDVFAGQFFEEFRDDPEHYQDGLWTHVIEPFDIPPDWKIYRSYDFGYSKPFSVGWWAVDFDGRVYRILELYGWNGIPNEGVKWPPDEQARRIAEVEAQHPYLKGKRIQGVADPAIWQADSGESVAETMEKHRIWFEPGDHQRIAGWMQVHYRLKFDEDGRPMMYFFSNCKAAIRTIPLMMYDETHVEDIDSDLEDHACDEIRYFCMTRPIKPREVQKSFMLADDPLNQRIHKRKQMFIQR